MANSQLTYKQDLERIKGRTVAVVYIFEGEDAPGFTHYHIWKSDIISGWLNAIQSLYCRPFILDVRTFVEKGLAGTLPHIDYVLNLNCGSIELSSMGLVPSTCAFLGIPCIPCDTTGIIVGENKRLSNFIAQNVGLSVPKELTGQKKDGIYRPLNYGSSHGVKRTSHVEPSGNGVYQEFIPGLDITTPYVYSPLSNCLENLPTVAYIPKSEDPYWFLGEEEKIDKKGYTREIIHGITDELQKLYLNLMQVLNVKTFCRIDARIYCKTFAEIRQAINRPLRKEDIAFIEVNTMPTVNIDNSFSYSFHNISKTDAIYQCLSIHQGLYAKTTSNSFLLACAMISYLRAMC